MTALSNQIIYLHVYFLLNQLLCNELNRKLEDIDTYNNANITEQYDVTMISPENGSTHQGSSYQKIGAKVILNLSIKQLNIGRNTIATLPAGYRPIQTLSFIISDGTETGIASVTIDSSGNIIGYASSSGYLIGYIEYYAMK